MTPKANATHFDPYAILGALQRERVDYVLIGGLARVVQGADEVADGLDLAPSRRPANLERLDAALADVGALKAGGSVAAELASEPAGLVRLRSPAGPIGVVLEPAGTRGYEDLRRKASRAAVGEGLRPLVAAPGDLVRMAEVLDRPENERRSAMMRRVVELDQGVSIDRYVEAVPHELGFGD